MNLIWLRNDLRLHDHPGFAMAQQQQQPVAVVFILPQSWLQADQFGLDRLAKEKARFLRACLIDLHRNLYLQNIPLQILHGDPVELLQRWHQKQPFTLLTHSAQAPEESQWLTQLDAAGIEVTTYENQTLFSQQQMQPLLQQWPASFSQFRRQIEKRLQPEVATPQPPVSLTQPGQEAPFVTHVPWPADFSSAREQSGFHLRGGESSAENWLTHYLWQSRAIAHYKTTRNQLCGREYSSQLSAFLAWGCLSVRKVWHAIKDYEKTHGADEHSYWLGFELLWREYFHWSLRVHGHRYFHYQGLSDQPLSPPPLNNRHWHAWQQAATGVPMIDAGLIELQQTGFCSNRMRQWLASFFINDLKLDWRLGARFFEQHLTDFDVASNWGNWAYLAGMGHDPRGQPGQGRYFALNKQLRQYDPELQHIHQWLPQLKSYSLEHILAHQSSEYCLPEYSAPIHCNHTAA
jgi:deoxyribodipyrimidine photo-lyase